jgi:opacity protein-like surface antigen
MSRSTALWLALAAFPAWAADPAEAERTLDRGRLELGSAVSFTLARLEGAPESATFLNLPVRLGYFVTKRLELEAELGLSVVEFEETETSWTGSAQALYHFGSGRVLPYVMAGGGIGDGVDVIGLVAGGGEDGTIPHVLVGAGVKAFVGSRVAFRTEYRYRHHWIDLDLPPHAASSGSDYDVHRLSVGISVFFR